MSTFSTHTLVCVRLQLYKTVENNVPKSDGKLKYRTDLLCIAVSAVESYAQVITASSFLGPLEESRCTAVCRSVRDEVMQPCLGRAAKSTSPSRSRAADDVRQN